jgi:hypothetical protein
MNTSRPRIEENKPEKNITRQPQMSKAGPGKISETTRKVSDAKSLPIPEPPPDMIPEASPRRLWEIVSVPIVWV